MATNFPASLDALTNPSSSDSLNSPSHSAQHANSNDAIEALQAKVGVDGSAVTSSIDYQLNTGYRYHSTLYFTSSGTFTKASYPWLRAIRVFVTGGGGGGGGGESATGSGQLSVGGGGGGGATAVKFLLASSLGASETVTVGGGGAGGSEDGTDGTASSFATGEAYEVTADPGEAGGWIGGGISKGTGVIFGNPGDGGKDGSGADHYIPGQQGEMGFDSGQVNSRVKRAGGGASHFGFGGDSVWTASSGSFDGVDGGDGGGGGGGGAMTENQTTVAVGGDGGNGVLHIELYA